ncbi:MAG: PEPxxWA-CTERM sorting domain-containing protein [Sphingomonadales bacterium]
MKQITRTISTALALCVGTPVLAAHAIVFDPLTYTYAVAGTGDSAASADIRNGFANPGSNYAQGMATTQTHVLTPNGTTASADVTTTSLAVPGRTSSAATYSSLDTGIMRANIVQTTPTAFGYPGADTLTQLSDTFFFTNTSGHSINLDVTFAFDGTAQVFEPNTLNGLAYLILGGCGGCSNSLGESVRFAGTGTNASIAAYSLFNEGGVYSVYDQYGGQSLNPLDFSVLTNTNGIGSIIRTTLVIPTGETSLGFKTSLSLSARSAASADFGHTAQFGIGALADGLSFTSASGVLLQGVPATGAVPEPASWAMMIVGFGAIGASMRRRQSVRTSFI